MKLAQTRAMVNAALDGKLASVEFVEDPVFGVQVPATCPNVPSEVLSPRGTWADKDAYDMQAKKLAGMFVENFKQYADKTSEAVKTAGPKA